MSSITSEQVSNMTNDVKQALFSANASNNMQAIASGLRLCNKTLCQFRNKLKKAKNTGEKLHLETNISHVIGYRKLFKAINVITGYGMELRRKVPTKMVISKRVQWVDQQSAFQERMRTGLVVNMVHKDVNAFLDDAFVMLRRRVNNILKTQTAIKLNAVFCGEFVVRKQDTEIVEFKYFTTPMSEIFPNTKLQDWLETSTKPNICKQLEEFQERDSGWALKRIVNIVFNINNYNPQRHGGLSYIPLPSFIQNKKACVNVQNDDEACFAWAIISALHPAAKNSHRCNKYPNYKTVLNLKNIVMPMTLKQVPRFEGQNDISVNVYMLKKLKKEKYDIVPCLLTKNKREKHVNLLLIQNVYYTEQEEREANFESVNETVKIIYHYVWIKNLSRLVSSQLILNYHKKHICDRCLHYFYSAEQLHVHEQDCRKMNNYAIRLPKQGEHAEFTNYNKKEKVPFIVYADIESILLPTTDKIKYQLHNACSISYYLKCSYDNTKSFLRCYTGTDCKEWFVQELAQLADDLQPIFINHKPMEPLTSEEQLNFNSAIKCHICEKLFLKEDVRVRDHNHLTGKFRGAAHSNCNLNYRDNDKKITIPIAFHNFSGYDSHFIIKNLAKDIKGRIDLLPVSKEKYISFTKHLEGNKIKFRFIDSFRFMASSLNKLVANIPFYPILKSEFSNLDQEQFKLLTRKGVFPYEYLDSWEKLSEPQLPPKEKFYSKLNDSNISDDDYLHAQKVWTAFNCQNLQNYLELYLKTDVLLLADVFEQFRASMHKTHKLDPAHYYTVPGYSWDAMLYYTRVKLELLTDIEKLMFIERGIRGGLSQCSKRHVKANNKYMSTFDVQKEIIDLIYFDINNQYGWAMSQPLPYHEFEWVEEESKLDTFNVNDIADNSSEGYILEVNLEYPQHLHDTHSGLPFCPEHSSPPNSKEKKLLATLFKKDRYVLHYRSLKQALNHGLKLVKIHRILKFKQSCWLKDYIDLNTNLRQSATNDFEKDLYKLMNNAVFGKTMENVRKYSNVKLKTKWEGRFGAEALISSPRFRSSLICDEDLVIIELGKSEILFNKPIYVGMCILDISKLAIYGFHYNYMLPKFGSNATICYTDTDSLIYEIKNNNIYDAIKDDALERFDTSDYSIDNVYSIPLVNKKVVGMMKDENNGKIMTEFVGLRSKLYATRVEGVDKNKKAKGVKSSIVKTQITLNDYLDCLNSKMENIVHQHLIKSEKHIVSTVIQTKIALCPDDDKRFICKDGIHTLAWGHYSIVNI